MDIDTTNIQLNCKANIRKIRESYGYSQSKFAAFFNMTTEAYRRIEVGPVNVPIEMLFVIKLQFGIPIDYLITGDKFCYDDTWIELQSDLKYQIEEIQKRMKKYHDLLVEKEENENNGENMQ